MSEICARLGSKGKAGVQRGRKTAGCPSFLPPPRGAARSRRPQTANPPAEVQRKTSRPERANMPAAVRVPWSAGAGQGAAPSGRTRLRQFVCPGQPVQEKEPPRQGEPACGSSSAPLSRCRKRCRTVRVEPACGSSSAPVNRCRKVPGSTRNKNFQENMRYPLAKYAKIGYYIQALFCMNSRIMLNDVKNTIIWRHSDYDRR